MVREHVGHRCSPYAMRSSHSGPPSRLIPLAHIRTVLLDFDGPICDLFSNLPNYAIADRLRQLLRNHGISLTPELTTTVDPFDLFRATAFLDPSQAPQIEMALADEEVRAAHSCRPTPHSADLMFACKQSHRNLGVVSNTTATAIKRYLKDHRLEEYVDAIAGRVDSRSSLLKPNPHLVRRAMTALGADPATSVLIGDQTSDIEAAHGAGAWAIGYANKPGKASRLEAAGADAIVSDLSALVAGFLEAPAPEMPQHDLDSNIELN